MADSAAGPAALQFEKDNGGLFVLFLKSMFLTVVSFGIYSFWARVAITRFIYGHLSFGGRPFDYHATGKELFIGFLKGMGILGCIGLAAFAAIKIMPFLIFPLYFIGMAVFIFVLMPFILVGKWRFWLSRSSWCNVRFRHHGSFNELLPIWVKGALLTIVTLGFYSPVFQNKLQKYYVDRITFGTLPFAYDGDAREYFWLWIKGILLTIITLGIYSFWFMAAINRFFLSHTTLNGRRLNSTMTGGGLFAVGMVNILIIVFTLGFGFPVAVNRMYAYFFENITLDADPEDLSTVAEKMDTGASALANGLEDAANVLDAVSGIV